MCSESSLYWGEPEHGGAFVGIYSLEVIRSIMQGFGWLPTPHSPEGCLNMYDTPPLFPPFPLLAWCNSPLNLENTYREHFRPRPVWIILALPAPEAATWVFISEVLNSGRTRKIILKTNGAWLWEDETQQNETPPLQGVAALSLLLFIVSQIVVGGWHCHTIPRVKHILGLGKRPSSTVHNYNSVEYGFENNWTR